MIQAAHCPNCGAKLVFGGDGRSRLCERCGYKETIHKQLPPPDELVRGLKFAAQFAGAAAEPHTFQNNGRLLLAQARGAVNEGARDEAYYCLEKVLHTDANDHQCAEAWLLLSQVYSAPEERRVCLEQALIHEPNNPLARRGLAILDGRLHQADIIDPNKVAAAAPADPQAVQAEQFQCPRCAARMNYTPDGRALVCTFCRYRQELDETAAAVNHYGLGGGEQDFIAVLATEKGHVPPVAMRAFHCMGCGIEFVLGPATLSLTCPYCDSVYVTEAAETQEIHPPQALIPFSITEDEVKMALRTWFKAHKVERPRLSPIVGVYAPVWTFDVGGEIRWQGKMRRSEEWIVVSGGKQLLLDDVLVPATNKLPQALMGILYSFALDGLVAYDARFLADWPAERYQLTLAEASLRARKQVLNDFRKRPYEITRGEPVSDLSFNSSGMVVESFKLILLPVWMIHYKLEDKVYDVVVNGQNGRVQGQSPQMTVQKLFSWLKGG
ncbi:MAG: hypothetical protein IPM39_05925 [Chloroflexi bacterium]|nr:hypothetical protein [Chloroflexota bacterium]